MSSSGRDKGHEEDRDADHLTSQFLVISQKHYIENISGAEGAMVGRYYYIIEKNGRIRQTMVKLKHDLWGSPSKVTNGIWIRGKIKKHWIIEGGRKRIMLAS
jgi:hypothetical protein